ncbi:dihydrolipoyl dehydrogenase [Tissierella carlieri]|uniref:dihydrolipoyl dehydrogenase n=1 Tax=Tissierella carlieri TaxID=689904 RepID=UPI001C11713F|nr:dihydrolipoyl dehydrogenase [Tissierella carlieri]MBU5312833.1 dihydrolipoyl dehydrogenase [Tissierella carlieri]
MKIVILGGGPGGYVCAIRAAQLGAEVILIEKDNVGGTCLNTGCIPTKALLHTTEIYNHLKEEASELGLILENLGLKWDVVQNRKEMVVQQLVDGVKVLLESNKVEVIQGEGKFISKNKIEVISSNKEKRLVSFDKAVIATGSKPARVPIPGLDLDGVLTSTEALSLDKIPKSICIIGGGVIGVEFANIYSNAGTKVTIVEMLPEIVANMDEEIVTCLKEQLIESGIDIYTSTRVREIKMESDGLNVLMGNNEGEKSISAEKILLSIGRKPAIEGLGLEDLGIETEKGCIKVDKSMRTNIDNIYAIGDCTGGALLAHVASSHGIAVAENIMGNFEAIDYKTTPYCIYTKPELAGVGLTEKQATLKGYNVKTGKFPLYANGKSIINGMVNGLVKFVIDEDTDEILGLHIAGTNATELIGIGALAIRLESTIEEIITTIHAHPTIGESIHEAAESVYGKAIHLPRV